VNSSTLPWIHGISILFELITKPFSCSHSLHLFHWKSHMARPYPPFQVGSGLYSLIPRLLCHAWEQGYLWSCDHWCDDLDI